MKTVKVPQKWTKKAIDGDTFYSCGSGNTLRSCLIRKDGTIEIQAMGLVTKYPPINKISESKQIEQILNEIDAARLCGGLQQGYDCKNVLFFPTNSLRIRCSSCQKRHAAEMKRERRKQIRENKISQTEKICIVKGCPGRDSESIRMFPMPIWDTEAWCKNLQLQVTDVNENVRVCSRHFDESSKNPQSLKLGTRPTLNLGHKGAVLQNTVQTYVHMCCIVGCNVTSPPKTLFSFPTDKELLKQWLLICVIKDRMLTNKIKYICANHFDPSMLNTKQNVLRKNATPKLETKKWVHNNVCTDLNSETELEATKVFCDANNKFFSLEPCVVNGCPGRDSDEVQLFKIPKTDMNAWCALLNLRPTDVDDTIRVCSRHFKKQYIGFHKIRKGARPTLNLGNRNLILPSLEPIRQHKRKICCIAGCDVTSPPEKKIYMFPKDAVRLKQWLSICNIKKEIKGRTALRICSKHFEPRMIAQMKLKRTAKPTMDIQHEQPKKKNVKTGDVENIYSTNIGNSENDELISEEGSDIFDGLECRSFCHTCARVSKECEKYRKRFSELEEMLLEEQANNEALKIINERLLAKLSSMNLV